MEHDKIKCQAPEAPILYMNNCGFFGSAATMHMCSKCHKDLLLKQEQAEQVASSVDRILNGSGSSSGKEPIISWSVDFAFGPTEPKTALAYPTNALVISEYGETKVKDGPKRCNTCRKQIGLTGWKSFLCNTSQQ